jgi:hypothetical protein
VELPTGLPRRPAAEGTFAKGKRWVNQAGVGGHQADMLPTILHPLLLEGDDRAPNLGAELETDRFDAHHYPSGEFLGNLIRLSGMHYLSF